MLSISPFLFWAVGEKWKCNFVGKDEFSIGIMLFWFSFYQCDENALLDFVEDEGKGIRVNAIVQRFSVLGASKICEN
jgi:hypothetical protein